MIKRLLIISALLNLLFICFFIGKRIYYYRSGLPENRKDIPKQRDGFVTYSVDTTALNKAYFDIFKAMPHDTSDIVFVGTSLTASLPIEFLKNPHIKTRGIGGNRIIDITHRISEVTNGHPKAIFLEAGTNDLKPDKPIDSIYRNWVRLANTIRMNSPRTKLLIESTLPFNACDSKTIETYNSKLKAYCDANHITFINLYPLFLNKEDRIRPELTIDGTHLTIGGHLIWLSSVQKYIKEL